MRRLVRVIATALALLASLAPPARAQDEPPADGVRLGWVRGEQGEGCIDRDAIATEVRRRLGRDPFRGEVRQTIEGVVGRADGRWVVRLFNRDAMGAELGTRELASDAESCRSLDPAVALAIALAIDPEAAMSAPPVVDPSAPRPEDATSDVPPEPDAMEVAPPHEAHTGLTPPIDHDGDDGADEPAPPREPDPPPTPASPDGGIGVAAAFAVDLVPGAAFGIAIASDATLVDVLRWRVGVLYVPEAATGGATAEFGFGLTAVTLDVCVRAFEVGPLSGIACVGGAAGAIHAVVYAPLPTRPGDYAWGAVRASAELSVEIDDRVWIALALTGAVPVVRWAFRVEGRMSTEFQQPWVIPGGTLGVGVRFW